MKRVLATLALVVVACATAPRKSAGPDEIRIAKRQQLIQLEAEIRSYRAELKLPPKPDPRYFQLPQPPARPQAQPQSDKCIDACNLADYICQAAEDICRIAGELGNDDWANEKCESARASCAEARKNCQECVANE